MPFGTVTYFRRPPSGLSVAFAPSRTSNTFQPHCIYPARGARNQLIAAFSKVQTAGIMADAGGACKGFGIFDL